MACKRSRAVMYVVMAFLTMGAMLNLATGARAEFYKQTNLVSDIAGLAKETDSNLVNSWGIAHSPTGPWWVNDNGTGVATVYNGQGQPFPLDSPLIVTIPPPKGASGSATPTGIVFNGTKDFEVAPDKPATFIFVTEDGTIAAWNQSVNKTNAILKVDNSDSAVYKGAATALNKGELFLYAANFRGGGIDVFDTSFKPVTLSKDAFTDDKIPDGFAPFNVMNISGRLFVTYAKQDAAKHDDVAGAGNGFVDIFDPDGTLLQRLETGKWLSSPWGVALAPAEFGKFSSRLLVGNFGSGQIAAYNPVTGKFLDLLETTDGKKMTIDGLWGLEFGNGKTAGPTNTLFFAAGIHGEQDGLFGTITPTGK